MLVVLLQHCCNTNHNVVLCDSLSGLGTGGYWFTVIVYSSFVCVVFFLLFTLRAFCELGRWR
jgi:hypothetical protein